MEPFYSLSIEFQDKSAFLSKYLEKSSHDFRRQVVCLGVLYALIQSSITGLFSNIVSNI